MKKLIFSLLLLTIAFMLIKITPPIVAGIVGVMEDAND